MRQRDFCCKDCGAPSKMVGYVLYGKFAHYKCKWCGATWTRKVSVTPKASQQVKKHPDGVCFYCSTKLTVQNATIDHVVPKSKGGTNKPSNKVLCCWKCNHEKADSLEWFQGCRTPFRKVVQTEAVTC